MLSITSQKVSLVSLWLRATTAEKKYPEKLLGDVVTSLDIIGTRWKTRWPGKWSQGILRCPDNAVKHMGPSPGDQAQVAVKIDRANGAGYREN